MSKAAFEKGVRRCIPSEFNLFSGSEDAQQSEELYNVTKIFDLPNVKHKQAGGLCTSSFLHILYKNIDSVIGKNPESVMTFKSMLKEMGACATKNGFDQIPHLTSSHPIPKDRPFYIVPPGVKGRRRALIIGINYTGQERELRASQNDAINVQQFLLRACGFQENEMVVLIDDGKHKAPTRKNIEAGFQRMVDSSTANDVVFISFSGHGGRVADRSGDEEDGYDSSLMPVDYKKAGQIIDDDILKNVVKAMAKGVHTTMLVDCCHSGSVADLPYTRAANARTYDTESGFNMDTHEEAVAKDMAAAKAEVERKQAKAERKKEREAIRKRKAEAAAKAAANPQVSTTVTVPSFPPGYTATIPGAGSPIQVGSPEEAAALAAKFGNMTMSPEQAAVLAKGGKVTLSSGPITMTSGPIMVSPEQAAAMQAQHKGGPQTIIVGEPIMVTPEQAAMMQKGQRVIKSKPGTTTTTRIMTGTVPGKTKTFRSSRPY